MVRIWRSLDEVPADLGRTVVTIGNFDGVHLGHQHVIGRAARSPTSLGARPRRRGDLRPAPDRGAAARARAADPDHDGGAASSCSRQAGADDVLVVPFDREIAGWPPERFVEEILVGTLHAKAVVVGANFRFGHKAAGDVPLLHRAGRRARLRRRGHPARRRTAGVVVDVRPQLPAGRRRRGRRGGARPPVHRARRGRQGRPARPRARLPDGERARCRASASPPTGCTPDGCAARRPSGCPAAISRRHQPDVRRRARAPRGGLRARPRRPRAVRRGGRGRVRRTASAA